MDGSHARGFRVRRATAVGGLFVCLSALPPAAGAEPMVDMQFAVRVPMRDGVTLAATIYRPAGQTAPLPAIFAFSPYIADNYHERAMFFAKHGYVFACVDVRGRGNSGGEFEPFVHEPADGHDVVQWLAQQPWCNGKVALWGSSYLGFDQWATLAASPPNLATILPIAAAYPGIDFPIWKNIPQPYNIQWLTMTSGATQNNDISADENGFWIAKFTQLYRAHRPFRELDTLCGNPCANFQRWCDHGTVGPYWAQAVPSDERYAALHIPILTVTGHYDADQWGALEYYRRHMRHGSEAGKAQHYLIIGPWDHAGTVNPKATFKGYTFGPASVLDMPALWLAWYDFALKGGPRPALLKQRVAWYLPGPGAEEWRHAESLETVANTSYLYRLTSSGSADDVFSSGGLTILPALSAQRNEPRAAPTRLARFAGASVTRDVSQDRGSGGGAAAFDTFTYDPLDTSPAEFEQREITTSIVDQTYVMTLSGRGLVYHTPPLSAPLIIAGVPRFTAWIELDVPDTDFEVTLYEIMPDGTSVRLAHDTLRARYRASLTEARLVEPGKIERYTFDTFNFFARRVSKGSRLRLVLTCPNSIFAQKNYNSGGDVARETAADARTAHVKLYHDAEHASELMLPIVQE